MKPTVGRIVHYVSMGDRDGVFDPQTLAAIITGLNGDDTVSLKVFYRKGSCDMPKVPFSETPVRGHWNWPPRG